MKKNKQAKPLVSTITSCYKGKKYLPLFLSELPKQTIANKMQVVLVHNEPSDLELNAVREFEKEYPNILKHIIVDPVEPLYKSWNRCINEADADLVAIWNIDDLRTPDSLEKQVKFLNKNPDKDVVHGNFVIVNSFGSKKGKMVDHSVHRFNPKEFTRSMILGPFFMWRKAVCEKIGLFDEQMVSGADFDYAVRLAANVNIGMVHGVLGYYLDEGRGASTRPDSKQMVERTLVELRYGIFDKLDNQYVPEVSNQKYKVEKIFFNDKEHSIENFIQNYDHFKKENNKP